MKFDSIAGVTKEAYCIHNIALTGKKEINSTHAKKAVTMGECSKGSLLKMESFFPFVQIT